MSINTIENETLDYLFCDLCRAGDCIYKFATFKQYHGWYCRDCYELTDEDGDEENDDNYIITFRMLKVMMETSTPSFNTTYYKMKIICEVIKSRIQN